MTQARLPQAVSTADGMLLLVTLLAACGWLFSKLALQGLPPLLFMAVRFLGSGLILLLLVRGRGQVLPPRGPRRCVRAGSLLGVVMMLWILGLQLSSNLGVAAFISSLGIVLAPFAARLLFATPLSGAAWGAMLLSALGMGCMSLRGDGTLHAADVLLLLAAVVQAAYLAVNGRDMVHLPVLPAIALQLLLAGVCCLAGSVLLESWQRLDWEVSMWPLLGSMLLATCLRYLLLGWGQGGTPVARAAFILMLEPVWTAMLAGWWYGTGFAPQQWLGAGLVLAALLLSRRK